MSNVFATDVQKQFYMAGLQDNLRDSLPFAQVSEIETENAEYILNRYGADVTAQSTPSSIYRAATGFTYSTDKKSINEIATVTDVILYQELMREGFDIVADRKDKHSHALRQAIHRHAVETARKGAGSVLDNEVLAGNASALTPITLSATNADDVAATVVQILQEQNAFGEQNPFVMMSPKQAKFFNLFSMGAGFSTADKALTNGFFTVGGGTRVIRGASAFNGLDVIVTNEMPTSVVLTFTDETDETDTIVIAVAGGSVTLTCDASPDGAGDYDQGAGGDEEATIDAVVALINNSDNVAASTASTTSGLYYELTQANRTILQNAGVRARKLTASTMEISSFGALTVTETGDEVTVGTKRQHMIAGAYNSTAIALPSKGMRSDEKPLPAVNGAGTHGYELTTFQMHDAVVWTYNAPKIVNIHCV
jgi:hypothetical protein